MPYAGLFALLDPSVPAGRFYYFKGSGIEALSDGAIDALVDSAEGMTSPYSQLVLMPVHGAATRVGESETAFAYRQAHLEVLHLAAWEPEAADQQPPGRDQHMQWARQSWQALQPLAGQRAYVNFLADEGTARVRAELRAIGGTQD
jgi:hypothetical protein